LWIDVTTRGVRHNVPPRWLTAVGRSAMRAARCPRRARIEVALVGDRTMRRLNWRYLRHHGTTDVITFGTEVSSEDGVLGEIVISVERARRQARRYGHSIRREVALLLVHGILHLRGYDDRSPRRAARMQAQTEIILAHALKRRR
jgi:probable rRNA maturation factor